MLIVISASVLVLSLSSSSLIKRILAFSINLGIAELSIVLSITTPLTSSISDVLPGFSSIFMSSGSTFLFAKSAIVQNASVTNSATDFFSHSIEIAFDRKHVSANLIITCLFS